MDKYDSTDIVAINQLGFYMTHSTALVMDDLLILKTMTKHGMNHIQKCYKKQNKQRYQSEYAIHCYIGLLEFSKFFCFEYYICDTIIST